MKIRRNLPFQCVLLARGCWILLPIVGRICNSSALLSSGKDDTLLGDRSQSVATTAEHLRWNEASEGYIVDTHRVISYKTNPPS